MWAEETSTCSISTVIFCDFCRCAMSCCDLDLTFDLGVVTLTYKILSGLYLGHCKVYKIDTW